MSIFDIQASNIQRLDDVQLRALVARLCEADLRAARESPLGVHWGGNQRAADGGLDVSVEREVDHRLSPIIAARHVGLQVKQESMGPQKCVGEMKPKPNGVLRPIIRELAQNRGRYAIVSGRDDCSKSMHDERVAAMRGAVADEGCEGLSLDFIDAKKLAQWVEAHPACILWLREQLGTPLEGWKPYGPWSRAPEDAPYLTGASQRMRHKGERMTVEEGIAAMRSALAAPGAVVRLCGLSGVGKTRFVESLFDDAIGEGALNPNLAIYADLGEPVEPTPQQMIAQIAARGDGAIVIADNCALDVHRSLTRAIKDRGGALNLLTVEYDIREDRAEDTSVYWLDAADDETEMIAELVARRTEGLSQASAYRIAEFSGGNARLALALAAQVDTDADIAGLGDEVLFERLFHQRHQPDAALMRSAELLSLVYSFSVEPVGDAAPETEFLAGLGNVSELTLHEHAAELVDRGLAQSREPWRAILPHAIATRLARRALRRMPMRRLIAFFENRATLRSRLSFAHRLHYLHGSDAATAFAGRWFTPDTMAALEAQEYGAAARMLDWLAPVSEDATLNLMASWRDDRPHIINAGADEARILGKLAYDEAYFGRATNILVERALMLGKAEERNPAANMLKQLCQPYLSGTHAPAEVRAGLILSLTRSQDAMRRDIGLQMLEGALASRDTATGDEYDFGARARDYGWWPRTADERDEWYRRFLDIALDLRRNAALQPRINGIIAASLRGLWIYEGLVDQVEATALHIREAGSWPAGWFAARDTLLYAAARMPEAARSRLEALVAALAPSDLDEEIAVSLFQDEWKITDDHHVTDASQFEEARKAFFARVNELGRIVAADTARLTAIVERSLTEPQFQQVCFGEGVAAAVADKAATWSMLVDIVRGSAAENPRLSILRGFLRHVAESDPEAVEAWLDAALDEPKLVQDFMMLQSAALWTDRGCERVIAALNSGLMPVWHLQFIERDASLSDESLIRLLTAIIAQENGHRTALEIIRWRYRKDHEGLVADMTLRDMIAESWRQVCLTAGEDSASGMTDYRLAQTLPLFFGEGADERHVKGVAEFFADSIKGDSLSVYGTQRTLGAFARLQPMAFFDAFFDIDPVRRNAWHLRRFREFVRVESAINEDALIEWCERDAGRRHLNVAHALSPFEPADIDRRRNSVAEEGRTRLTSLALRLVDSAPDARPIIATCADAISPNSWSGSRAEIMAERITALSALLDHPNEIVRAEVAKVIATAREHEAAQRAREAEREGERQMAFE